jgi:hypothetical protein
MTYYMKSGNTFRVSSKEAMDLHETLPVGNYTVNQDMMGNLFLQQIESFTIGTKLYGDTTRHTGRIFSTFMDRDVSTGVLLNGEKGSGKSLLAKNLSVTAAEAGVPTIVINQPWVGDKFNTLIQSIEQPCVVLFDEFEKVYDEDSQEQTLTLLDGVFPSKKLFILTCNDKWRIDKHMRNRPGRIFYMLDFKGLDADFIREYCEDRLDAKEYIERIVQITGTFSAFNFDMLKALVEEMNRYNEPPQEAMKMLNAKPEYSEECKYKVHLHVDGKLVEQEDVGEEEWRGNPLNKQVHISYKIWEKDENGDEEYDWRSVRFATTDLKKIENDGTRFMFENERGIQAMLVKIKEKSYNIWDAL